MRRFGLFRYAIDRYLENTDPAGGGGGGGGTPPAIDPAANPKPPEDVTGLKNALESERGLNKTIKEWAKEKGLSVEDALKRIATDGDGAANEQVKTLAQQIEALKQSNQEAVERAKKAAIKSAVTEVATAANALSVKAVLAELGTIELDEEGNPKGVAEAVAELKKSQPELFRHAHGSLDGGRPPRADADIKPGVDRLREAYSTESKTANVR